MKYLYPFYKEEQDDARQTSILLPFLGGALIGGLIAPAFTNKNPGYYYPGYYPYGYPTYTNYYSQSGYTPYNPYIGY